MYLPISRNNYEFIRPSTFILLLKHNTTIFKWYYIYLKTKEIHLQNSQGSASNCGSLPEGWIGWCLVDNRSWAYSRGTAPASSLWCHKNDQRQRVCARYCQWGHKVSPRCAINLPAHWSWWYVWSEFILIIFKAVYFYNYSIFLFFKGWWLLGDC